MYDVPLRNFKPRRDQSHSVINHRGPLRVFGQLTASELDMIDKNDDNQTVTESVLPDDMQHNEHVKVISTTATGTCHNGQFAQLSSATVNGNGSHVDDEPADDVSETNGMVRLNLHAKYSEEDLQHVRRQLQADYDRQCELMRKEYERRLDEQCDEVRRECEEMSQQMSRSLRIEYEDQLRSKEKQWSIDTDDLLAASVSRDKEKDEEIERLQQQISDMRDVVTEYEMTLLQVEQTKVTQEDGQTGEESGDSFHGNPRDRLQPRIDQLEEERDQALADFANVETSFSHLYQRYEKMKTVMDNFKKNENILKQRVSDMHVKVKREEDRYAMLKKHAEERILSANEEIARLQQQSSADMLRLQTILRRYEMRTHSLELAVKQKTQQNQELEAICDDLLNRVHSIRR